MRRTTLLLAAGLSVAAFAAPSTSSAWVGCSPVPCTISGVLEGSEIFPNSSFDWPLRFTGAEHFNGYVYRQPPARLVGTAVRVPLTPSAYVPVVWREVSARYGYQMSGYLDVGYGRHVVYVSGTLVEEGGLISGTLTGAAAHHGLKPGGVAPQAKVAKVTISAGRLVGVFSGTRT